MNENKAKRPVLDDDPDSINLYCLAVGIENVVAGLREVSSKLDAVIENTKKRPRGRPKKESVENAER